MSELNKVKKSIWVVLILFVALFNVFADDNVGPSSYTQEIILIAIVPPVSEVKQVVSTKDSSVLSTSINDLYIDNGVIINLINMSPELINDLINVCISKIAEEINRGAFHKGSNAGLLIRTNNSQFKISQDGVAYTANGDYGKTEIRTIIKSLVDDYSISDITYANRIVKVNK